MVTNVFERCRVARPLITISADKVVTNKPPFRKRKIRIVAGCSSRPNIKKPHVETVTRLQKPEQLYCCIDLIWLINDYSINQNVPVSPLTIRLKDTEGNTCTGPFWYENKHVAFMNKICMHMHTWTLWGIAYMNCLRTTWLKHAKTSERDYIHDYDCDDTHHNDLVTSPWRRPLI